MGAIEVIEERLLLTTYTVLTNADSGADSLRQAILDANDNPGADTIAFNLQVGSLTINPLNVLPNITDPLTIDGTSQPGYAGTPLVVLNGSQVAEEFNVCLEIDTSNSTIKGLAIQDYVEAIVIGGFGSSGVAGNHVELCYLGLNTAGTASVSNYNGVRIDNGATNNVIGGTAGQGNVISGNTNTGVVILGEGTSGNRVEGNTIGTSPDKTTAISNGAGVGIAGGATGNTIGGLVAGASNLISGNVDHGILILGTTTAENLVQGNLIGTNGSGTTALGVFTNSSGILMGDGAHDNLIGGTTAAARNVIAGVNGTGIQLYGEGTAHNTIQGNYLGVDITGTVKIEIGDDAIFLEGVANNLIGGTAAGAGNVISGAARHGLVLFGEGSTGNTVQGNRIGTNAAGTGSISNASDGIRIDDAPNNTIGGSAAGAGNLISGNDQNGITLTNIGGGGNLVEGNLIGVQVDGTSALPNLIDGVEISFGAGGNQIGGTAAGEGNVIAFNGSRGVNVNGNTVGGNSIIGNSIYSNAVFEIDLNVDLATANDPLDADTGPNSLQNFPVLSSAVSSNGSLTIQGTLNSSASHTFGLAFYSSPANDGNGFSQGQTYLGSSEVTTGPSGAGSFAVILPVNVTVGHVITATANRSGTSEFSASRVVTGTPNVNPILVVSGETIPYSLGAPATLLASNAQVVDADSPNFGGGQLVAAFDPKGKGKELLGIRSQGTGAGQISVVDGTVQFGGTAIGTVTGGKGKKALTVTFNNAATAAAVQELVRNITYQNQSKKVKAQSRTVQLHVTDNAGHASVTASLRIFFV